MKDHITKSDSTLTVFVSYRRTDAFAVDQLVQALQHEFGEHHVIQDTVTFEPGASFPKEIEQSIRNCKLMLVVIGPRWCGSDENSIMLHEDDWVRREVELAIKSGRPLLPVLLSGASMPETSQLPDTMHDLLSSNAVQLRTGEDAIGDLRRLTAVVRKHLPRDWRRTIGETAFMVVGMVVMGLGGASLCSKTLLSEYAMWQWPNVMAGIALALLLPTVAVMDYLSRQWAAKWRRPQPLYRQHKLHIACLSGLLIALVAVSWPPDDPISDLYASLESTRKEVPRVEKLLSKVRAMPRYADNEDVQFVDRLLEVRKSTTLSEDAVNSIVNALTPYLKQLDNRRRLWAALMTAEAYRFVKKYDEQIALYQQVAQDHNATAWQRWYAHHELGTIYYQHKDDSAHARINWDNALKYFKTVGLLLDLAILDEDENKWESANNHYKQAEDVLKEYKNAKDLATLADQEAVLYANWGNMLRLKAKRAPTADQAGLRLEAMRQCRKAVEKYTPYLDAHWNLARIQLDARDFNGADMSLRSSLETLRNLSISDPNSLNRYGYNVYGERYTLWLLVVSRFLSDRSLQGDAALWDDFRRTVVRLEPDVVTSAAALLTEMHELDLKVYEDRAWLAEMVRVNYL